MALADQICAYVEVLARWGPEVAMEGCAALIARDAQSKWFETEN